MRMHAGCAFSKLLWGSVLRSHLGCQMGTADRLSISLRGEGRERETE